MYRDFPYIFIPGLQAQPKVIGKSFNKKVHDLIMDPQE